MHSQKKQTDYMSLSAEPYLVGLFYRKDDIVEQGTLRPVIARIYTRGSPSPQLVALPFFMSIYDSYHIISIF